MGHTDGVRLWFLDLDDNIAAECEQRRGDLSWRQLIEASLTYSMHMADAAEIDELAVDELAVDELAEPEPTPPAA